MDLDGKSREGALKSNALYLCLGFWNDMSIQFSFKALLANY